MARLGFTTRASCLIAAGATALLCGLVLGVVDLVRAGLLCIAVPVAAAVLVLRTRVRIAHRRSSEPARATAGEPVTVHLAITNRSVLGTGALLLEDQLPEQVSGNARFVIPGLSGRETRTVSYRMPDLPRGTYRFGPLRIRLTDPFHMIDITRSFTSTNEFVVAPIVDRLPSTEPPRSFDIGDNAGSHSIGAHGADDASTREYRTGDDLRKIHWRSSARVGSLMVRLEERPWQGRTTLLLDLRGDAHASTPREQSAERDARQLDSLEWAVSAAASIGTHLMIAGREVGLVDGQGEHRWVCENPTRLLDHLAPVRPSRSSDLSGVGDQLRRAGRDSALIAIVGTLDPTSVRVLAESHPRGSAIPAFALLLDTATWQPAESGPGASTPDKCSGPARVLRSAGWQVVVVRRGAAVAGVWGSLLRPGASGSVTAESAVIGRPR